MWDARGWDSRNADGQRERDRHREREKERESDQERYCPRIRAEDAEAESGVR